jgi:hypothetical protein
MRRSTFGVTRRASFYAQASLSFIRGYKRYSFHSESFAEKNPVWTYTASGCYISSPALARQNPWRLPLKLGHFS